MILPQLYSAIRFTAIGLAAFAVIGCSSSESDASRVEADAPPASASTPSAFDGPRREPRTDLVESLRADLEAVRHPSDGGGRAWLEDPSPAIAGRPGRWTIHYEVGPEGIADGGSIFLQISPFWGWSTPQTSDPARIGYTDFSTYA